ncbi:MAG: PP2C family serine/threonine-protein phosphatase [Rhodanobacteraceae bacterium]
MKVALRIETGTRNEDRAAYYPTKNGALLVIADGAGNSGQGAAAADRVLAMARREAGSARDPGELLTCMDRCIAEDPDAGETTSVIVILRNQFVHGASVGDSGAWILARDGVDDLTQGQVRKPLLGSGVARAVGFGPVALQGRLLVATDGLLKYVALETIRELGLHPDIEQAATTLCDAARLADGRLPDDIGLLLVE